MHKAGFVNIVGKPNAGKSTLLNQLMGEKLAIVTQKAQTTRHRIFGIYNEEDVQIVFSDTPGVLDPKYELQEKMMSFVKESLQDADVFLFIVDISDKSEPSEFLIEKLNKIPIPVLLLINKIDKSNQKEMEAAVEHWHNLLPKAEILPISALNAYNTEYILPKLKSLLPENPPYYDKDQFTDKSERFFVNETVREKILLGFWCCIKRLSSVKSWSRFFIILCYLYPKFLRSFSFFLQSFFTFTKRLRWIFFAKNFSKSSLASVPTFLIASPLWPIKIPFWVSRST